MSDRLELLAEGFGFLECPRWREGRLWTSDMGRKTVWTIGLDGRRTAIVDVPGKPAGLGFLPDGTPLVVSMEQRRIYRIVDGRLELHADLATVSRGMLNDMVVDARGRAYVDNSGYNPFGGETWTGDNLGSIILVEPDGSFRTVAEKLAFPNGILLTGDGRLVVAESRLRRLTGFALLADGSLADRRVVADLEGDPDGVCLDVDGALWIGLGKTEKFVRWHAGAVVEEVSTPGYKAVACQLGGGDGRQFFGMIARGETADIGRIDLAAICTWPVASPAAGSP